MFAQFYGIRYLRTPNNGERFKNVSLEPTFLSFSILRFFSHFNQRYPYHYRAKGNHLKCTTVPFQSIKGNFCVDCFAMSNNAWDVAGDLRCFKLCRVMFVISVGCLTLQITNYFRRYQ